MTSPFSGGGSSTINRPEDAELLADYLDKRALEPSDFPQGLVIFRDATLLKDRNYVHTLAAGRPYILLRYLRPDGTPYLKNKDPYEIPRFLGSPILWRGEKPPPKAINPSGRPNVLHFEPVPPDWDGTQRDWHSLPDGQIVVHVESMVKAKAVSKWLRYPCVGLNGVRSYSASKSGAELIYEGTGVDFSRFTNVILYDSNVLNPKKPDIAKARSQLAFKLRNVLGCKDVRLADLPRPGKEFDEEDWGPDDFIRYLGNEKLNEVIQAAEPFVGSLDDTLLEQIRDKVVYCTGPGLFIDRGDKVVRDQAKASLLYRPINRKELMGKNTKTTYAFQLLLDDKDSRREVVGPCCVYLGEEFIEKPHGEFYNLYTPDGPWPDADAKRTGAADRVIAQLYNLYGDKNTELLRSYLRFLKFDPNKPSTCLVIHGTRRGQGKGWTGLLSRHLIGFKLSADCVPKVLTSNFNAQLQGKRLLVFNEFKWEGSRDATLLSIKRLTGDAFITIEPKGVDSYDVENFAGAIFTTNFVNDVPTDGLDDRRMIYMEASNKVEPSDEDWIQLRADILDPAVMNDFALWLQGGEYINFATWKPDVNDEERQRIIIESGGGLEGAARSILYRLRHDTELKPVCIWFDTLKALLEAEGYTDLPPVKTLSVALKKGDWVTSVKDSYGPQGKQRKVYLVDRDAFARIEDDNAAVRAEADRMAIALQTDGSGRPTPRADKF